MSSTKLALSILAFFECISERERNVCSSCFRNHINLNTNMTVLGGLKDKSLGCCVVLAK